MKSTLYPVKTLLFVKLDEQHAEEGLGAVVPYYVNRDTYRLSYHYLDVVAKSEGITGQLDNLCTCTTSVYMARFPDREKLPITGAVIWVRFEEGVDPTEAMCNMAIEWSEVFGTDGWNTLISESFVTASVPVNLIITNQLRIGPIDVDINLTDMVPSTS